MARIGSFDFLRFRKRDYQLSLGRLDVHAQRVLGDLAKFCRANESCVVPGDRDLSLILEGRREVWLRIANHLHLTPAQLYAIYTGHEFNPAQEDQP